MGNCNENFENANFGDAPNADILSSVRIEDLPLYSATYKLQGMSKALLLGMGSSRLHSNGGTVAQSAVQATRESA